MALLPSQFAAIGDTASKGVSNLINRKANKEQLKKEGQALDAQSDYIGSQSDLMRSDYNSQMSPYVVAGQSSLNDLQNTNTNINSYDNMLGNRGDYGFEMGNFQTDPGYEFRKSQGIEALDQSAAGDGSLFSGGQQKELMEYGQNLASDEYQNVYDREFGEFQDANNQFKDARDYNTALDANNLNRDINLNQNLNNQGYNANMANANTGLGVAQDETAFGVDNIAQQYGNSASKTANKYGLMSDQVGIANDGFQKFMGGSSFGGK